MEIDESFVFQADSDIVNHSYHNHLNYTVVYHENVPKEYCIIYFSSNDLYYPNNDIAFKEGIIQKNRFEWIGNRVAYGYKHIFIRDIKKQWYLEGINSTINTPTKLYDFLKTETKGFKIILLGSSAGGFIAVIMGQMLGAERIYSFNGQFEIKSLLEAETAAIKEPILYRNQELAEFKPYYESLNFITNPSSIFYFHSSRSSWDIEQYNHVKHLKINVIKFQTRNHGIPFLRSNLKTVLAFSINDLVKIKGITFHPLLFSIKYIGVIETLQGLGYIAKFILNKIYINTIQKLKAK